MKKQIVAMLMIAAFTLSTTACAKDTNAVVEEDVVEEAGAEASEEIEEAVEEASDEASVEASDEAVEEASEEASEETATIESLDDVDPDKVYKNEEFGVAVIIDDDMTFSGKDKFVDGGDSIGANSDNELVEAFSYYNNVCVSHAEADNNSKVIDVSVADLSEKMKYPEAAYAEMSLMRRKISMEKEFDEVETESEKMEIMGETHFVVTLKVTKNGRNAYESDLYLIKDKRLLTVVVISADKESATKIFENLRKYK